MSLTAKLIALGVLLAAILGGATALYWRGHSDGDAVGAGRVQKSWDAAKQAADTENAKVRGEGYTLAAEYESQLNDLEKRHAKTSTALRKAMQQQVVCPTSGRIGDLVLPADVIDSMFNRERSSADPSGPATAQPDETL